MPELAKKKAPRASKPSAHPPFSEMIATAIKDLADKKGSSRIAIKRHILAKFKLEDTKANNTWLNLALRRGVTSGQLTPNKHHAGLFRILKTKKSAGEKSAEMTPKKSAVKKTPKKTPVKKAVKAKSPLKKAAKAVKKTPKKSPAKKVGRPKKIAAKKPAVKKAAKK